MRSWKRRSEREKNWKRNTKNFIIATLIYRYVCPKNTDGCKNLWRRCCVGEDTLLPFCLFFCFTSLQYSSSSLMRYCPSPLNPGKLFYFRIERFGSWYLGRLYRPIAYLDRRCLCNTDFSFLDQKELAGNRQHEGIPPQGQVNFILIECYLHYFIHISSPFSILHPLIHYYFGTSDYAMFCQKIEVGLLKSIISERSLVLLSCTTKEYLHLPDSFSAVFTNFYWASMDSIVMYCYSSSMSCHLSRVNAIGFHCHLFLTCFKPSTVHCGVSSSRYMMWSSVRLYIYHLF